MLNEIDENVLCSVDRNKKDEKNEIFLIGVNCLQRGNLEKTVKVGFEMEALIDIPNRHIHTPPVSGNL